MMPLALVVVPMLLGLGTLFIRGEEKRRTRRFLLAMGTVFHFLGTVVLFFWPRKVILGGLIQVDPLGLLFLAILSVLFLLVSIYSLGYFHHEREKHDKEGVSHLYAPCMLFFLAAMTLTTLAAQVGILWIAIEATTIASAPLIYYHHHHQALEAAWKYLLTCSVGIAIALLGIFFIIASGQGAISDLSFSSIAASATALDPRWLRIGFLLVLVGFGTKMGLAPFHSWLPDAHGEAPSPVSALLSGALLNCAFLGILRFYNILTAAGLADFGGKLLLILGLISLGLAAVSITRQRDYKRLLAYSSVEHMGILALGLGVGAPFAVLLHVINHSLTKGLLFLVSGRILMVYRTKNAPDVHGLLKTVPATGTLFLLGGLAIVGFPPFAPFVSEFLILREGLLQGHGWACFFYLLFLGIIFVAMTQILLSMVQGERKELEVPKDLFSRLMILPPMILAGLVLLFGLYLPAPMTSFLKAAAFLIGGSS